MMIIYCAQKAHGDLHMSTPSKRTCADPVHIRHDRRPKGVTHSYASVSGDELLGRWRSNILNDRLPDTCRSAISVCDGRASIGGAATSSCATPHQQSLGHRHASDYFHGQCRQPCACWMIGDGETDLNTRRSSMPRCSRRPRSLNAMVCWDRCHTGRSDRSVRPQYIHGGRRARGR